MAEQQVEKAQENGAKVKNVAEASNSDDFYCDCEIVLG